MFRLRCRLDRPGKRRGSRDRASAESLRSAAGSSRCERTHCLLTEMPLFRHTEWDVDDPYPLRTLCGCKAENSRRRQLIIDGKIRLRFTPVGVGAHHRCQNRPVPGISPPRPDAEGRGVVHARCVMTIGRARRAGRVNGSRARRSTASHHEREDGSRKNARSRHCKPPHSAEHPEFSTGANVPITTKSHNSGSLCDGRGVRQLAQAQGEERLTPELLSSQVGE